MAGEKAKRRVNLPYPSRRVLLLVNIQDMGHRKNVPSRGAQETGKTSARKETFFFGVAHRARVKQSGDDGTGACKQYQKGRLFRGNRTLCRWWGGGRYGRYGANS